MRALVFFATVTFSVFADGATGVINDRDGELGYSSGWIEAAIAYGRTSDPKPYVIRAPSDRGVATGLVYTPFLRVAILARQSEQAGRTLAPRDIPASILEPVIYVRFYDLLPSSPEFCQDAPFVFGMVPTGQVSPEGNLIEPLWVREISRSVLYVNPHEADAQSFLPVAAFPLETARVGYDFVVYRKCQSVTGSWRMPNLRGVIREEDLRTWR